MSKKNVLDNIMNYFNDEEEEEEEDEEEGNYIPNYNKNNKKNVNKKKGTSLKELNSSLTINNPEDEEEKIINKDNNINNDNNNNFYSYLGSNSSRPDTPKLNENKIKEGENINEKKREENEIKDEDNNDIFSETIKTKLKDINSNIISLEDNNNILESYDESVNSRQTFFKNENINENQKINNKESQKDIPINEKEDISKNKKEVKDEKKIIDSNIEIKNNELNEEKNKEEENNIKIENNKNNNNINLKNNINNEYSDMIRRNKLSIELQKTKEKLRQIENLNIENNLNENMEKIINKEKEEFSNNNFNNINYLNFKDMKEIYKDDYIDKEKEKEKDLNIKAINEKEIIIKKENEDLINNINSNNIDNLFIPIMNNNIIENEIKKNRNKLKKFNKDKKQLTKSKSSEQFNTKFNINKSSFKWLSSYNEKLISKIILKNSDKNKQISILGIIKTLHTLKILHNLLSKNKLDLNNLNENVQKQKEVDFVEQIWFLLNPNNKKVINNEIFECFIKLLFPYTNNLKQSAIEYIEEYIKIINFMEPKSDIKNNDEYFYSPLRNEYFPKNKKWSTEKIIQTFFELKRNRIAYKKNFEKINKEENKNNENKKKKRANLNFDELYESFMIKKEAREKTLNIMREEQEKEKEEIISKYTYIPKIIKNKENKWKNIYDNNNNNNKSVYDKLYERRKDKEKKIKKLKDKFNKYDIENKKIEKYSFKPEINNFENSKKQFEKNDIPDNCKKYIKKNLEIIKRKKELKLEEENKYNGTNYEKIRKIKFKCKGPLYEPKKIYKNEKINKEIKINDKNNFTVKIKLPNKKDINLTVNINENIKQKVEKLCKIYSLDNNIKEKIINQIESYKEIYNQEGHN